jgi:hypothetical protein
MGDEKWIDGAKTRLSEKTLHSIDKLLDNTDNSSYENGFLDACRLFHIANKYYSLKINYEHYDFSIFASICVPRGHH